MAGSSSETVTRSQTSKLKPGLRVESRTACTKSWHSALKSGKEYVVLEDMFIIDNKEL